MHTPDIEIENKVFDDIVLGDSAEAVHEIGERDIALFAAASGDVNPTHLTDASGAATPVAHSLLAAGFFSMLFGTRLPGPGTVYRSQDLRFLAPVRLGDRLTTRVTVLSKQAANHTVRFDCVAFNQDGDRVLEGEAVVVAPLVREKRLLPPLPQFAQQRHIHYDRFIERAKAVEPIVTAVAHPCDESALGGAIEAAEAGMIRPLLVGPPDKILAVAEAAGLDVSPYEIVAAEHSHASAAKAVELVRSGRAELLMKGSLHSDELLHEVAARDTGLRSERRISHIFIMDVPSYPDPLFITDAAVNIFPDLEAKRDIIQNAIDLYRALDLGTPRVAILSAVETVTPKIPGTLDAAALCKMADRGQITGGIVDGPLAFDNAISVEAAKIKGIASPVAGRAQILIVPDLEAGNMLAKNLSFLAGADAAGIVMGARAPIMLTSRADSLRARMASCAVAVLYAHALRAGRPSGGAAAPEKSADPAAAAKPAAALLAQAQVGQAQVGQAAGAR